MGSRKQTSKTRRSHLSLGDCYKRKSSAWGPKSYSKALGGMYLFWPLPRNNINNGSHDYGYATEQADRLYLVEGFVSYFGLTVRIALISPVFLPPTSILLPLWVRDTLYFLLAYILLQRVIMSCAFRNERPRSTWKRAFAPISRKVSSSVSGLTPKFSYKRRSNFDRLFANSY